MIPAMVRLLVAVGFGAFIVLFVFLPLRLRFGVDSLGWPENAMMARLGGLWPAVLLDGVLLSSAALIATWALFHVLRKLTNSRDRHRFNNGADSHSRLRSLLSAHPGPFQSPPREQS